MSAWMQKEVMEIMRITYVISDTPGTCVSSHQLQLIASSLK